MAAGRLILEIGHGGAPLVGKMRRRGFALNPRDTYVGVDSTGVMSRAAAVKAAGLAGRGQAPLAAVHANARMADVEAIKKARKTAGLEKDWHRNNGMHFVEADARQLPFQDDTFHEVHMHNVVTAPGLGLDAARIAAEACRVLRPGGRLVIVTDKPTGTLTEDAVMGGVAGLCRQRGIATAGKAAAIAARMAAGTLEMPVVSIYRKRK